MGTSVSPCRKGGLIGLAAVTVGLASAAEASLAAIVPPVLASFTDPDSRVRWGPRHTSAHLN